MIKNNYLKLIFFAMRLTFFMSNQSSFHTLFANRFEATYGGLRPSKS